MWMATANPYSQLCIGDYAALKLPHYPEEPQIGKIIEIKETTLKVDWLKGAYSILWKQQLLQKGRKLVHWEGEVERKFVLPCNVEFTKSKGMTSSSVGNLKAAY